MHMNQSLSAANTKYSKAAQLIMVILLAALPSLYLLLSYPPFFNDIDCACYFNFPHVVPHYPLFYPLYCFTFLKLVGDGMWIIYGTILVQHVFYVLAVTYISYYFNLQKQRIVFTVAMFFAFRASIFIHGIYSESWAIIAVAFMVGALLRICLRKDTDQKRLHYLIYTLATVLLLLTRFAGLFLIFVLPLFTLLTAIKIRNPFSVTRVKTIFGQVFLCGVAVLSAQFITTLNLIHFGASDFSVYGRPGTYRISDAMNPKYSYRNGDGAFSYYQSMTHDTLVKSAFRIIKGGDYNQLWNGAFQSLDSLRKRLILKGIVSANRTTDDCLNSAYKIYIAGPEWYPYKTILSEKKNRGGRSRPIFIA